jgi:type IV secretory pathway VirB2 component (pilin)
MDRVQSFGRDLAATLNRPLYRVFVCLSILLVVGASSSHAQTEPAEYDFTPVLLSALGTYSTQIAIVLAAVVGFAVAMLAFNKGWGMLRRKAG